MSTPQYPPSGLPRGLCMTCKFANTKRCPQNDDIYEFGSLMEVLRCKTFKEDKPNPQ